MNLSIKKSNIITLLCFSMLTTSQAMANENGGFPIGLGQNLATAGAGAGSWRAEGSEAVGALNANPALASRLDNQISAFISNTWVDQYVDASAAGAGRQVQGRAAGKFKTKFTKVPAITFGGNYWLNDEVAIALGVGGGMTPTKYDSNPTPIVMPFPLPPLPPQKTISTLGYNNKLISITGVLAPSLIYKPSENQGYGISALIGMNQLKANIALPEIPFTETKGNLRKERIYGFGVKLGGLWNLNDYVGVGAAVSTPVKFQKYKKYSDIIKNAQNIPATVTLGTSISLTDATDLLLDIKEIFFRSEKFYKEIKWRNQVIYMAGLQHQCTEQLTMRAGYNYGKSPIRSDGVLMNLFAPHIVEHHVTAGVMYKLNQDISLSAIGEYAFPKKLTDNGNGPWGVNGKGAVIKAQQQTALQIGAIWHW